MISGVAASRHRRPEVTVVNSDAAMGAFEELTWRGLVQQTTAENMGEVLATPLTMYVGCDPSAPSLHAGNLVPLMLMTHLRRAGHQVIALVGGATGMIGDPSGKSSERKLLGNDEVTANTRKLRAQIEGFFANDERPARQDGRQPGVVGQPVAARFLARRRQALRGQPDDPARLGQVALRVARGRHLVHRVLVHAAAGVRLPGAVPALRLPAAVGRVGPVGEHRRRASTWCAGSRARRSTASPRRC